MNNVVQFDPIYLKLKKMWIEDRWQFSGKMVNLTIKQSNGSIDEVEAYTLATMNRIVEEFDGKWLDESRRPSKKIRKKG